MKNIITYTFLLTLLISCKEEEPAPCIIAQETWGIYDSDSLTINGMDTFPQNYYKVFSKNVAQPLSQDVICSFYIMDSFQLNHNEYALLGHKYVFVKEKMDTLVFTSNTLSGHYAKFLPSSGFLEIENKGVFYRSN